MRGRDGGELYLLESYRALRVGRQQALLQRLSELTNEQSAEVEQRAADQDLARLRAGHWRNKATVISGRLHPSA